MTVARQGVDREKNSVASLNMWPVNMRVEFNLQKRIGTHFQRAVKLRRYVPLSLIQFVLTQVRALVSCDVVDGRPILYRKRQHVECRIPPCSHIARHSARLQVQEVEGLEPQRKEKGCRVENGEGDLAELSNYPGE